MRRLGGVSPLVWAIGGISAAVTAVGVVALVSWLRHDPKERQAATGGRLADQPSPKSPEAAVKVAQDFCDLMAARKFAEAALMVSGAAADLVRQELQMRLSHEKMRDPELLRILDQGLSGQVLTFQAEDVRVTEGGDAVSLRARMRVSLGGQESTMSPRIQLRWSFDHWLVDDFRPHDGDAGRMRL